MVILLHILLYFVFQSCLNFMLISPTIFSKYKFISNVNKMFFSGKRKACSVIILNELYRPICVMEPIIC